MTYSKQPKAAVSSLSSDYGTPSPVDDLKTALRELLSTLLDRAFGVALDKVEHLAQGFDDMSARGGMTVGALLGGAQAAVKGGNMVWGAVKGAFGALSGAAKAALIVALVLALLLLPVTVVLLLVALIVIAVVAVVRQRSAEA